MPTITHITPDIATASQPDAADFAQIAALGFKSVINNRPDSEDGGRLGSDAARREAAKAGLSYAYIPAPGHALFEDTLLDSFDQALRSLPGPVLIHCHTGTRSAILWALAAARISPVKKVLRTLAEAGLDIEFLEPQLNEQAAAHFRETDKAPAREGGTGADGSHAAIAPRSKPTPVAASPAS